ncbi:MAG: GNAT family N-acetyltransferase [Saprospiraceae bacterium]|nr:GNAT family N-acetyltransferase [Saprospiraceae bacterium]
MKIEVAGVNHLNELTRLFEAYRIWYRMPPDLEGSRKFLNERLSRNESIVFSAFDKEERMVGFTQLYPLFSSTRLGRLWLLNDLFVNPDQRGQGISLLLIERAKRLARETNAVGILLETEKSNQIGNQLYPRTEFHLESGSNFYFWTNENRTS